MNIALILMILLNLIVSNHKTVMHAIFTTETLMWEHMLSKHNIKEKQGTPRRLKCNIGDVVGSKSRVIYHMKVHMAEKKNSLLDKFKIQYNTIEYLPSHLARHKGTYYFKCAECCK